jgi:hypothetical protein
MTFDENGWQSSPQESWPRRPITKSNRWRAIAAVVSAVAIIALFALLLRGFVIGNGRSNPPGTPQQNKTSQASAHGQWHEIDSMKYTTGVFTQTPYPVFSPKDPHIVYETALAPVTFAPVTLRRSDDGGAHWQSLTMPSGSDQAIDLEIFASPLDAQTAFLTITVNLNYGQTEKACPSTARSALGGATHGTIVAQGRAPCSTTYRTTDKGESWQAIRFPVNGTISSMLLMSTPFAGTTLQAQGTKLFAMLTCGPTCGNSAGRLVSSGDGGQTWNAADGNGLGGGVCDFTTLADSQTIFAAISNGSCDGVNAPPAALYRSNDDGQTWLTVGELPQRPGSQGAAAPHGMVAMMVGGKPLLIMNLPVINWDTFGIGVDQSADEFYISSDGGHTWQASPTAGAPAKALPIVAPLIVRADGSLVVAFSTPSDNGQNAKLYTWKADAASWQVLAPAPEGHIATLRYTISPMGDERFWAVITSGPTPSGITTFSVASYQP